MTGYLDIHGARAFLGGRSVAWMRLHVHEIPHLKLYDRLLFDPTELRVWLMATAKRHVPIDVDSIVASAMKSNTRRGSR